MPSWDISAQRSSKARGGMAPMVNLLVAGKGKPGADLEGQAGLAS